MKSFRLSVISLLFIFLSCENSSENSISNATEDKMINSEKVMKIYLNDSNQIEADGLIVELGELDSLLKDLNDEKGIVYYSKSESNQSENNKSSNIIELIIKYQLPIKLFTDDKFEESLKLN